MLNTTVFLGHNIKHDSDVLLLHLVTEFQGPRFSGFTMDVHVEIANIHANPTARAPRWRRWCRSHLPKCSNPTPVTSMEILQRALSLLHAHGHPGVAGDSSGAQTWRMEACEESGNQRGLTANLYEVFLNCACLFLTLASFADVLINRKQLVNSSKMEISSVRYKFQWYTWI